MIYQEILKMKKRNFLPLIFPVLGFYHHELEGMLVAIVITAMVYYFIYSNFDENRIKNNKLSQENVWKLKEKKRSALGAFLFG